MEPPEPPELPADSDQELRELREYLQSADQLSKFMVATPPPAGAGRTRWLAQFVQSQLAKSAQVIFLGDPGQLAPFTYAERREPRSMQIALAVASRVDPADAAAAAHSVEENTDTSAIVDQVSNRVPREKVAQLTHPQLLLLILTWLIAIGIPFAATQLPESGQVVAANEIATMGLALAITGKLRKRE